MKRITFLSSLLLAALGIVVVTTTNTAAPASMTPCDFTWTGNFGDNWQETRNWVSVSCDHDYPVAGDTATIPNTDNDPLIDDQDEAVLVLIIEQDAEVTVAGQTLTIDGSGGLDIDSGGTLTIGADGVVIVSGGGIHDIDGDLLLNGANAILRFTSDATVDGDGNIIGSVSTVEIELADADLTNEMVIEGKLTIEESAGTSSFINGSTGVVLANDASSGTLLFDGSLESITDASGAQWCAMTNSGAVLRFDKSATGLVGKFELCSDAIFMFANGVNISTIGCFDESASGANGSLDFLGTGSFCHDDDTCSGGSAQCYTVDTIFNGDCAD